MACAVKLVRKYSACDEDLQQQTPSQRPTRTTNIFVQNWFNPNINVYLITKKVIIMAISMALLHSWDLRIHHTRVSVTKHGAKKRFYEACDFCWRGFVRESMCGAHVHWARVDFFVRARWRWVYLALKLFRWSAAQHISVWPRVLSCCCHFIVHVYILYRRAPRALFWLTARQMRV
jgi:hypothetical protein